MSYYQHDFKTGTHGAATFTRTGDHTYDDANGEVQTVGTNVAAISTHEGMLLEDAGTNLFVQSEDFTSGFGENALTITANQAVAPDGFTTADELVPTAVSAAHFLGDTASVTSGSDYTEIIFVNPNGYNYVQFTGASGFSSAIWANFLLTGAGSVSAVSATAPVNHGIESIGNGWYMIWYTQTATLTTGGGRFVLTVIDANTGSRLPSFTGDGTSGVYVWGNDFKLGSFPSSYVKTAGSDATRNADSWLADTTDDLGIGDETSLFGLHLVLRPQHNYNDTRGESKFIFHWIGANNADQGLNIFYNDGTKVVTFRATDESNVSAVAAISTGPAYSRNDPLNIRARKTPAGYKVWVNGISATITTGQASADFNVGLSSVRIGGRRTTPLNRGHNKFDHLQLWTGEDLPTDAQLEAMTTEYVEWGNTCGFAETLLRPFSASLSRTLN